MLRLLAAAPLQLGEAQVRCDLHGALPLHAAGTSTLLQHPHPSPPLPLSQVASQHNSHLKVPNMSHLSLRLSVRPELSLSLRLSLFKVLHVLFALMCAVLPSPVSRT